MVIISFAFVSEVSYGKIFMFYVVEKKKKNTDVSVVSPSSEWRL